MYTAVHATFDGYAYWPFEVGKQNPLSCEDGVGLKVSLSTRFFFALEASFSGQYRIIMVNTVAPQVESMPKIIKMSLRRNKAVNIRTT